MTDTIQSLKLTIAELERECDRLRQENLKLKAKLLKLTPKDATDLERRLRKEKR